MRIIYAEKNSKFLPWPIAHIYRLEGTGKVLYRIECQSWNRHGSTNAWDVFLMKASEAEDIVRIPGVDEEQALTQYDGIYSGVAIIQEKDTPVGTEREKIPVTPVPVLFDDATEEEVVGLKIAAADMLKHGWGPHGKVAHQERLRKWIGEKIQIGCCTFYLNEKEILFLKRRIFFPHGEYIPLTIGNWREAVEKALQKYNEKKSSSLKIEIGEENFRIIKKEEKE